MTRSQPKSEFQYLENELIKCRLKIQEEILNAILDAIKERTNLMNRTGKCNMQEMVKQHDDIIKKMHNLGNEYYQRSGEEFIDFILIRMLKE